MADAASATTPIDFRTSPERYKHWKLSVENGVAYLTMDVNEDGGLKPGYKLKLNSYDLGVDIELHDALQRIRFEHPAVRAIQTLRLTPRNTEAQLVQNWRIDVSQDCRLAPVEDVARNLERWVDAVVIRTFGQRTLEEFAKAGTVAKIPAPPAGKRFAIDRNAVKVTLADQ